MAVVPVAFGRVEQWWIALSQQEGVKATAEARLLHFVFSVLKPATIWLGKLSVIRILDTNSGVWRSILVRF